MILMIDNYDSFTFNLVQYFQELGQQVEVVRNDAISCQQIIQINPSKIVISPGPGTPDDAGISLSVVEQFKGKIPLLGVCLGHQVIAQYFGAKIVRAKEILHGKTSEINHRGINLFLDLPEHFAVTRYHSLTVDENSLPANLEVDAWVHSPLSNQRTVMSISDRQQHLYGIQFHPEAILSENGHSLLENFLNINSQH